MNPEYDREEFSNVCVCKLESGELKEYDLGVSEEHYNKYKEEIDREYFNDKRKIFLGWGFLYSINGVVQSYPGKRCCYFNWKAGVK
jgi:hypothetical protein